MCSIGPAGRGARSVPQQRVTHRARPLPQAVSDEGAARRPPPPRPAAAAPPPRPAPVPEPAQSAEEAAEGKAKAEAKAAAQREKEAGNAAYKAKRFEEALGHYTRAVELDDTDISFLTNRRARPPPGPGGVAQVRAGPRGACRGARERVVRPCCSPAGLRLCVCSRLHAPQGRCTCGQAQQVPVQNVSCSRVSRLSKERDSRSAVWLAGTWALLRGCAKKRSVLSTHVIVHTEKASTAQQV